MVIMAIMVVMVIRTDKSGRTDRTDTGQTDQTFNLAFQVTLCRAAFAILATFLHNGNRQNPDIETNIYIFQKGKTKTTCDDNKCLSINASKDVNAILSTID